MFDEITPGAWLQAGVSFLGLVSFLVAIVVQWRTARIERAHDIKFADNRMAQIEKTLTAALEELKLMRETLLTVANQGIRLDFLEKMMDEMRRGIGMIQPAQK